jgi:hypothetical protein
VIPDGFNLWSHPDSEANEHNLHTFRNEVSPFARVEQFPAPGSGPLIVDSYYGLAYDFDIPDRGAIYGVGKDLPQYSADAHANRGFLRTAFRRIPRILVRNRRQLDAICSGIQRVRDLDILYRGQEREYLLPRAPESLEALYGDPYALEPSLTPSAGRSNLRVEEVLPFWLPLLNKFMDACEARCSSKKDLVRYRNIRGQYELSLLSLALAQHYGLPSVGLDVSPTLDVALFFALYEFRGLPGDPWTLSCRRKSAHSDLSVLYVLCPRRRFRLGFDEFTPPKLNALRPTRQDAFFLHTGWGMRQNACAENLFIAIYLDPAGDFGVLPTSRHLFPDRNADEFGAFLEGAAKSPGQPLLQKFLSRFKWVTE